MTRVQHIVLYNGICRLIAVLFFLFCFISTVWGRQFTHNRTASSFSAADTSMDLYLLIGQSNMAGRGIVTGKYATRHHSRVLMLDKNNKWVMAVNPLHFDKPAVAGVGPGLSFGIEMAKAGRHHTIGLIPCAVGGTSINSWTTGQYDKATNTYPFDDMVKRLQTALRYGRLKGVIWLQGEADSSPEKAKDYLGKLEVLIARLRSISGDPLLPFIAGELGRFKAQYQNINNVLKELPGKVARTAVASSSGLKDKGDKTHYDSSSAEIMGKRFAKQMKRLLKN